MNVSLIESAGGSTNPFYSVYHGTYEACTGEGLS